MGVGWLKHRLALRIEQRALAPGLPRVITNSEMVKRDVMQRHAFCRPGGGHLQRSRRGTFSPAPPRLARSGTPPRLRFRTREPRDPLPRHGVRAQGAGPVIEAFPDLIQARPHARLMVVGYDSAARTTSNSSPTSGYRLTFVPRGRRDARPASQQRTSTYSRLFTTRSPTRPSRRWPRAAVITTAMNGASELLTPEVNGSVLQARRSATCYARSCAGPKGPLS